MHTEKKQFCFHENTSLIYWPMYTKISIKPCSLSNVCKKQKPGKNLDFHSGKWLNKLKDGNKKKYNCYKEWDGSIISLCSECITVLNNLCKMICMYVHICLEVHRIHIQTEWPMIKG